MNRASGPLETDGQVPRRIAYVTTHFPSVTQTFVFREVLELERRGWDVRMHAFKRAHLPRGVHPEVAGLVGRCVYPSVRSIVGAQLWWLRRRPVRYLSTWWFALRGTRSNRRRLLRSMGVVPVAALFARGIDAAGITHTHAHWATEPALAAAVIARLTEGTYSFTAHAYDIQLDRTMLRDKAEGAAFVATISELNRRSLEASLAGSNANVAVIHCGVDAAAFPSRDSAPTGPPFAIVSVGALEAYKGHRYLLGAAAILSAEGHDFSVRIIGDGAQRAALVARAIELGISNRVEFLGVLSADEIRRELSRAVVFAMPSIVLPDGLTEGIPVAMMEAMAVGVPVVASDVAGIHELVADRATGLLVPPADDAALASALRRVIEDPRLALRLSSAASVVVSDQFDLRQTVGQLERLFLNTLADCG
jgi:glycosyltransferase involved in cell wall biosynthesis